jgi:hypothetical protein
LTASLGVSSVIFLIAPFSGPGSSLSEQPQKAPLSSITPIKQYDIKAGYRSGIHGFWDSEDMGTPSSLTAIPHQVRPDRVQVNVAHQSQQVDIFLAQDEFKAVLKSEYRASFYAPHHDVMQGTRSVDSRSPWHATPLSLPTLAVQLDNLTAYPFSNFEVTILRSSSEPVL